MYCHEIDAVAAWGSQFLAKLLVGTEVLMDRDESSAKSAECRALKVPPIDPHTVTSDNKAGHKFNTVTGYTMWYESADYSTIQIPNLCAFGNLAG